MSRILTVILFLGCISGAQAYIISIDTPEQVNVGSPLIVTGSTSFPQDTQFDIVLYYSKYTAGELKRQTVIVDKSQIFRSDFETRDLERGQYKVEIHNIISNGKIFVEGSLGSSSVTRRVIQLVDRSDQIILESPMEQDLGSALVITGRMKNLGKGVITLRVFGPEGFTFGPQQLITNNGYADKDGHFSTLVPVSLTGEYQVSFSDKTGFIGELPMNVTNNQVPEVMTTTEKVSETLTPEPTMTSVPRPKTATPTPTQSPVSLVVIVSGVMGASLLKYRRE
ncbi:MAG TPA: hypothetical protein VN372_15620 [Methanospirillum sp.]|nr:hypothetical protein [Methanospirillum sp.]